MRNARRNLVALTVLLAGLAASSAASAVGLGAFTTGPDMPAPTAQSVVVAQGGKLYIFGGYETVSSTAVTTVTSFDPSTNTYAALAPLPAATRGACGGVLASGKILVVGGYNVGEVDLAQIYDPATNSWSTAASVPSGWECAAVVGADGRVHLLGGESASTTHRSYDEANNQWLTHAALPVGRTTHGAGVAPDGRIVVFGGGSGGGVTTDIYNPTLDTWAAGVVAPAPVIQNAFVTLPGTLLAMGGSNSTSNNSAPYFDAVQAFDTTTNQWTTAGVTLVSPTREAGAALLDGKVYVFGGSNGAPIATLQIANLDSDEDGTDDATDNCLLVANPTQVNADMDTLGDACDSCPNDAENDADTDGLCGDMDNCPDDANPDQADADADGVGDACDTAGTGGGGAGGGGTGGASGTGGAVGTAGSPSSGGSSAGGDSGSGGGSGSGSDDGCGCRVAAPSSSGVAALGVALLGLALGRRRSRRA